MTINERIKLAIKWLIGQRVADNQEEVGKLLGYSNKSSFSQVIMGKCHYLMILSNVYVH